MMIAKIQGNIMNVKKSIFQILAEVIVNMANIQKVL